MNNIIKDKIQNRRFKMNFIVYFRNLTLLRIILILLPAIVPVYNIHAGTYIELTDYSSYATGQSLGGDYYGEWYWDVNSSALKYEHAFDEMYHMYEDYLFDCNCFAHLKVDLQSGHHKLLSYHLHSGLELVKTWMWVGGGPPTGGTVEFYYRLFGQIQTLGETVADQDYCMSSCACSAYDSVGGQCGVVYEELYGHVSSNNLATIDFYRTGSPTYDPPFMYGAYYDFFYVATMWGLEYDDFLPFGELEVIHIEFAIDNYCGAYVNGNAGYNIENCKAEITGQALNSGYVDFNFN
jgi:hypothetical protein